MIFLLIHYSCRGGQWPLGCTLGGSGLALIFLDFWVFELVCLLKGTTPPLPSWAPFFPRFPPAFQTTLSHFHQHHFLHLALAYWHFQGWHLTLLSSFSESCSSLSLSYVSLFNRHLWACEIQSSLSPEPRVCPFASDLFLVKHLTGTPCSVCPDWQSCLSQSCPLSGILET